MEKRSKPNERSQALLKEIEAFQAAMRKGGFAEATRTVYLRAFDTFAKRLDRKTPATATLREAKHHLTELKQDMGTDIL
jgi:hypothetical protein